MVEYGDRGSVYLPSLHFLAFVPPLAAWFLFPLLLLGRVGPWQRAQGRPVDRSGSGGQRERDMAESGTKAQRYTEVSPVRLRVTDLWNPIRCRSRLMRLALGVMMDGKGAGPRRRGSRFCSAQAGGGEGWKKQMAGA